MTNGAVAEQEKQRGEPSRGRPLSRRRVRVPAGSTPPRWLLPIELPAGKVRTVGDPQPANLTAARQKRWRVSAKGRAYYKRYMRRKGKRAAANAQSKLWRHSPKGRAWLEKNRERINAYYRLRYHTDGGKRRAYLTEKQREYRAIRLAA